MHKVWILDCKSCRAFLTNRGMKAVLLLRPSVPLYSTDALPANCSAVPHSPPATYPPPTKASQTYREPPRTCECLTQTLSCHGCGSAVGYMIVAPCVRCTSSLNPPPQPHFPHSPGHSTGPHSTNGHRFVFHSSEIVAEERLYVPGEPGVDIAPLVIPSSPQGPIPYPAMNSSQFHPYQRPSAYSRSPPPAFMPPNPSYSPATMTPISPSSSYHHSADPEIDGLMASSHALFAHANATVENARRLLNRLERDTGLPLNRFVEGSSNPDVPSQRPMQSPRLSHQDVNSSGSHNFNPAESAYASPNANRHNLSHPGQALSPPSPTDVTSAASASQSQMAHPGRPIHSHMHQQGEYVIPGAADPRLLPHLHINLPELTRPILKSGDVIHWHHLSRRGELPGVVDDERARPSKRSASRGSSPLSPSISPQSIPASIAAGMVCAR